MVNYYLFQNKQLIRFDEDTGWNMYEPFSESWENNPNIFTFGSDPGIVQVTSSEALAWGVQVHNLITNAMTSSEQAIQAALVNFYDSRYARRMISLMSPTTLQFLPSTESTEGM